MSKKSPRRWTNEEDEYIRQHWETMSDKEMAFHLSRNPHMIANRRCALKLSRRAEKPRTRWSEEEIAFLEDMWGSWTSFAIANHLHRSVLAVEKKAASLGLYGQMACGDMFSLEAVTQIMGLKNTNVVKRWMKKGLKARRTTIRGKKNYYKINPQSHYVIRIHNLLDWLRSHPEEWDSRKVPKFGLGRETKWLVAKREADHHRSPVRRLWTKEEESRLRMMVGRGVPYAQIAKDLQRTKRSINAKAHNLGLRSGSWNHQAPQSQGHGKENSI